MYEKIMIGLLGSALLGCSTLMETAAIASDRMLTTSDNRVFVLGLYENPADDAVLRQVAEAGFNLVQAKADTAALDRLEENGLYAWINTGPAIDFSDDQAKRKEQLQSMANSYASHPALLVWEVPDEALWNCWYGATRFRTDLEPRDQQEKFNKF